MKPFRRILLVSLAASALFVLCYAGIASTWPYQRGFDDYEHIPAAVRWSSELRLTADGLFLRVPLWHMLLGTFVFVFGVKVGLFALQAGVVCGAVLGYLLFVERVLQRKAAGVYLLPPLLFVLSPQALLYARHAVNEPFVGLLSIGVLLAGALAFRGRPVVLGLLCGAALMTKTVAVAVAIPALTYLLTERTTATRRRRLLGFAAGMAAIVAPLVVLHLVQRGAVPMDTTAAYNLSGYPRQQWRALGDHMERYEAGMQIWRADIAGDPGRYLAEFAGRFGSWWVRPGSADFSYFYRDYPHRLIQVLDPVVLYSFVVFAAIGTRRRDLSVWAFLAVVAIACTFPRHTPYSPKVILVYPTMLLAAAGISRIRERFLGVKG